MAKTNKYYVDLGHHTSVPVSDNDMAFNIGSALGGLWGYNYNKRGDEKAEQTIQEMLHGGQNAGYSNPEALQKTMSNGYDASAQFGIPTNGQPIPNASGVFGSAPTQDVTDALKQGQAIPQPQQAPQIQTVQQQPSITGAAQQGMQAIGAGNGMTNNTVSIGGNSANPTKPQVATESDSTAKNGNQIVVPERNLQAEKLDYLNAKYNSGSDNPDGDRQQAFQISEGLRNNIAGIDFTKLPNYTVDNIKAAIRAQLVKDGRTSAQIDYALGRLDPTIKAKVGEADEYRLGELRNTLDTQIKNGALDDAGWTLQKMADINPKYAAAMGWKYKRAQNRFNNQEALNQKIALAKQAYPDMTDDEIRRYILGGNMLSPKQQMQQTLAYNQARLAKMYGNNNNGKNNGVYGSIGNLLKDPDYMFLAEERKRLEGKEELTDSEKSDLERVRNQIQQKEIQYGYRPAPRQYDVDNYNDVGDMVKSIITQGRQRGMSDAQLAQFLQEDYKNNPYVYDWLQNYGLIKPSDNAKQSADATHGGGGGSY